MNQLNQLIMINKHKLLGIHLLVASLLTLIWTALCPEFTRDGQTQLHERNLYVDAGHFVPTNKYYQLDFGLFVAGEAVIWSAVLGSYFLLRRDDA